MFLAPLQMSNDRCHVFFSAPPLGDNHPSPPAPFLFQLPSFIYTMPCSFQTGHSPLRNESERTWALVKQQGEPILVHYVQY